MALLASCAESVIPADTAADAAGDALDAGTALTEAGAPDGAPSPFAPAEDAEAGVWTQEQALCPQPGTACASGTWHAQFDAWTTLLEAREFGEGTHFRALSGAAVSLENAQGDWSLVQLRFSYSASPPHRTRHTLPVGQRVVGMVDRIDRLLVLACSAPAQACVVHSATEAPPNRGSEAGALVPSEVPNVPARVEARGMYQGVEGLCVYGRGLWCLRGTQWESQLNGEPAIRSVRRFVEHTAIESAAGTFWVSSLDAAGKAHFQAETDLSVLDPKPDQRASWTQLRDDELWFWNGRELTRCGATPPLAAYTPGRALSKEGTAFGYDYMQQRYCEGQQLGPIGPVIATSTPMCGIVTNSFALTESVLLGTTGCAID